MSRTVDERVVEMRFDNAQFESGVKTSLSTLDKLKAALKFDGASKGLDDVSKSTKNLDPSISAISKSVEALEKRFSTFGIIGMEVIRKMTDAALNFATSTMAKVTSSIVSGGMNRAQAIEDARFMLDGLLHDSQKVNAVFAVAQDSVDGTAFSMDAAAKAASMFTASGLEAGTTLDVAMKALAGTAAMAKGDYEGVSDIFTKIAGSGRIMGEELNMFASRGLNVAATLAEYYREVKGEVDMTEEGIRKLISDKKTNIYFEEFADAMNWAFGDQAKKANETFTGSLANIKSALSRIGAKFYAPLIERNGALVGAFNAVRVSINEINKGIDPLANKVTGLIKDLAVSFAEYLNGDAFKSQIAPTMKKVVAIFNNLIITLQYGLKNLWSILQPVMQGLQKFIPYDILGRLVNFTNEIRKATVTFNVSAETSEKLRHTFEGVSAVVHMVGKAFGILFNAASPIGAIFHAIGSAILTVTSTIGQFLVQLDKTLFSVKGSTSGLSFFEEVIKNVGQGFKSLFTQISQVRIPFGKFMSDSQKSRALEALHKILTKLKDAFLELTKSFANIDIFNNLQNGVDQASDSLSIFAEGPVEAFVQSLERVADADFKFPTSLTEIKDLFDQLVASVVGGTKVIIDSIKKVKDSLNDGVDTSSTDNLIQSASDRFKTISGMDTTGLDKQGGAIQKFLDALKVGLLGKIVFDFSKYLNQTLQITAKLAKSWNKMFDAITDRLKGGSKWQHRINMIKSLAVSIGILAGSLWLIAGIPADDLERAKGAMLGLAVGITAMAAAIGVMNKLKLFEGEGINNFKSMMLVLVGAITVMVFLMKQFEGYNLEQICVGLLGIGGAAAVLVVSMAALAKVLEQFKYWSGKTMNAKIVAIGEALLFLATAIAILSIPIKMLGNMNILDMVQGLAGVGAGMSLLLVGLEIAKNYKVNNGQLVAMAGSMILMAMALTALAVPITLLGLLPLPVIAKGMLAVGVGLGLLTAALTLASNGFGSWQNSAKSLLGVGAAMVLMATALTILMVPITVLGLMPWGVLIKGLTAVAVGLAAMTLALDSVGTVGGANAALAGVGMMAVAAALNMLIPPIVILGALPFKVIAQGIGAFLVAMAGFAVIGMIATAGAVGLLALGGALLMIAGAIAVAGVGIGLIGTGLASLAAGLTALSLISTPAANAIVNSLGIILTGLIGLIPKVADALIQAVVVIIDAILTAIIQETPKIMEALNTIIVSTCALIAGSVPAIVETLLILVEAIVQGLSDHAPIIVDRFIDFIIGIIYAVAERIPEIMESIGFFISAIVKTIVDSVNSLSQTSMGDLVEHIAILGAFFAGCAALSVLFVPAMAGVLAFGALVTELTAVLTVVGAINKIPGIQDFVKSGGDLLQAIGTAIGQFVGGFVGGVAEGVTSSLPKIGENLSEFMTNVQPFLEGATKIDASMMDGVDALVGVVLAVTAASFLSAITTFLSGGLNFVAFGVQVKALGEAVSGFAESIDGIDASAVESAAHAAQMLAEVIKSVPSSGALDVIFGKNDIQEFGRKLDWLGYYLVKFAERVDGKVSEAAVQAAANAGRMMVELADSIPNTGGLLSMLAGENDMQEFGKQLDKFGFYLVKFSQRVDGKISESAVQAAANAGAMMVQLADTIPNTGGLLSFLAGDNDMKTFGEQLLYFGYYITDYSTKVANLDTAAIDNSIVASKSLVELADALGVGGGLLQNIIGGQSLQRFGEELAGFGKHLLAYSIEAASLDRSAIAGSVVEIKKLIALANDISTINTSAFGNFSQSLTTMAHHGIDSFANAFTNASSKVGDSINTMLNSAITIISNKTSNLQSTCQKAGETIGNSLISGMNRNKSMVSTTAIQICNDLINTFRSKIVANIWTQLGSVTIMQTFISAIQSKKAPLSTLINDICKEIVDTFTKILTVETFTKFGEKNMIGSLMDGIKNKADDLLKYLKKLCEDIVKTFKDNLKEREFKKLGTESIKALISGFNDQQQTSALKKAVQNIGEVILAELKKFSKSDEIKDVGVNITKGIAEGIADKGAKSQVITAIRKVIQEAVKEAKKTSKEKSPSKVFAEIGKFFDLGMAEGIDEYAGDVASSTKNLSKTAIDSMRQSLRSISDIVDGELDYTPTITPVIDLSNIQNGSRKMRGLITKGLNTSIAYNNALLTSVGADNLISSGGNSTTTTNNYNFTQNNYSPKALSRKEIYRQTKNQFSALKGAVSG